MSIKTENKIGLFSMILLGVNGIIGSGIFLLPGQVMALAGQASLLVYGFVTLLVLMIAWSFAKCAALFTRNGGAYVYAKEAFGPFIGFEIGLMRWAVGMIAWATMAVAFVTALSTIWAPALQEPIRSTIVLGMIGLLGIVNVLGVNWIKPLNNIVTIAKLLPLLIFVLVGLYYLNTVQLISSFSLASDTRDISFGAAALLIFYAFSGFENLVVAAGEMENPKKNLPIAIMLVVGTCSLIYMLIQIISMGLLGNALAGSVTPIADASHALLGAYGKWFVIAAMMLSIGGINISASFTVPRGAEALADDGLLPKQLSVRGQFDTPVWAILVSVIITGLIALFGTFTQLATISVIARFIQYISTCLAALVLCKVEREAKPFLWRIIDWMVPIAGLCGMAWLLSQASLNQLYWGLSALLFGVPLYFMQKSKLQEA